MEKKDLIKVNVEWIDSASNNSWTLFEDVTDEPIVCESCGWLIKETKEYVTLALTIGEEPLQVSNYMTIPKCSIKSIKKVEIGDTIKVEC